MIRRSLALLFSVACATSAHALSSVDLVGKSLDGSPHFDMVQVFNEGEVVEVAVDPSFYPALAHALVDVYLVSSKTVAEWDADASLVDLRGAPQTIQLGAPLEDGRFSLTGSSLLASPDGERIARGFDVVVDANRDGALSPGDLIDGYDDREPGFFVARDLTAPGPFPVEVADYSIAGELQRTWYPSDIAAMEPQPLVVISHGNGHQYQWYDYLQSHLASYGYVVMSHANLANAYVLTRAETLLRNVETFLGQLDSIEGGVFQGRVDAGTLAWIGHSRGGQGVVYAYDLIRNGSYSPVHFTAASVKVISAIAPTDLPSPATGRMTPVPLHLLYGAADGDVTGAADSVWPFAIFERSAGDRLSTYVHGASHNDFNCCGFDDFSGPPATRIGPAEAQAVAKLTYAALLGYSLRGEVAGLEVLTRPLEDLRPLGIQAGTVIVRDYVPGPSSDRVVLDDFQAGLGIDTSSAGGAVSMTTRSASEGLLREGSRSFASLDTFNGLTRAVLGSDFNRGLVFEWNAGDQTHVEFELPPSLRDVSMLRSLALRTAQITRHPLTLAELGNLDFTVALVDADGTVGSLGTAAYGYGAQQPYARSGGWANEFETASFDLIEFARSPEGAPSGLDLSNLAAVRLEYGSASGSAQGRVVIDDLRFTGVGKAGHSSSDADADGLPDDIDPDDDDDGVLDANDAFPFDPTESSDTDRDGVGDNADAFPLDPAEAADTDADGVGDNADIDDDDDGLPDTVELSLGLADQDGDGSPNSRDLDSDNDGLSDLLEAGLQDLDRNFLLDPLRAEGTIASPPDRDADGLPDFLDTESRNPLDDGSDYDLIALGLGPLDTDGDGRLSPGDQNGGVDADRDGIDDLIDGEPALHGSSTDWVADFDGNGSVDGPDFDLLRQCWTTRAPFEHSLCSTVDLVPDEVIGPEDFAVFTQAFHASRAAGTPP